MLLIWISAYWAQQNRRFFETVCIELAVSPLFCDIFVKVTVGAVKKMYVFRTSCSFRNAPVWHWFVLCVVQIIRGAGHHVYSDRPELFNNIVSRTCDMVDQPNALLRPIFPSVVRVRHIGPAVNGEASDCYRTPSADSEDPVTSSNS